MVLIIPEGWDLKVDKQWFICVAILFISYVSSLHAMQMITKFFSFESAASFLITDHSPCIIASFTSQEQKYCISYTIAWLFESTHAQGSSGYYFCTLR